MIENNPTNVDAACEILLEQIVTEIDLVNQAGARAFQAGNHDQTRHANLIYSQHQDNQRSRKDRRK
jgi:hypothetical protein